MNNNIFYQHYLKDKELYFRKVFEEIFEYGQATAHYIDDKSAIWHMIDESSVMYLQLNKVRWFMAGFDSNSYDLISKEILETGNNKVVLG